MSTVSVLLAIVLTAIVLWAVFTAQRLNRMHIRLDAALVNLQAALDMRAAVIAASIEPLAAQAYAAQSEPLDPRDVAPRVEKEKELIKALQSYVEAHPAVALPRPISDAAVRVQLTHRFYNDAVVDTRALRIRPLVRILRLGGRAPMPQYVELPLATPIMEKVSRDTGDKS
ncbi:hypothetical protein CCICO_06580 [Corynebacterium ciconiae DSM 44920]|uniref:hypothetical protein n=1 Tax=Corynebacterium ciconiae TaxID=227319 RepID=UPI00037735D4|nr:hypothetical protein [Corynebacterium ciconiae]WKD61343.1 hypothetical protein CCICO_06580 [Corynebacterium ciconiae DSM 44920]